MEQQFGWPGRAGEASSIHKTFLIGATTMLPTGKRLLLEATEQGAQRTCAKMALKEDPEAQTEQSRRKPKQEAQATLETRARIALSAAEQEVVELAKTEPTEEDAEARRAPFVDRRFPTLASFSRLGRIVAATVEHRAVGRGGIGAPTALHGLGLPTQCRSLLDGST